MNHVELSAATEADSATAGLGLSARVQRAIERGAAFSTIFTDQNLVVQWASDSVFDAVGYRPSELIGLSGVSLLHPDDVERSILLLEEQARNPVSYGEGGDPARRALNSVRFRHKDGTFVAVEMAITNLSADPDVNGFLVHARQADDRYFLEQAYRQLASGSPPDAVIESAAAMLRSQFIDAEVTISMDFGRPGGLVCCEPSDQTDPSDPSDPSDPWTFIVLDHANIALGTIRINVPGTTESPSQWVRTVVSRAEDILRLLSQHEMLVQQLRLAATTDALTGAANRRGLSEAFEALRRRPTPSPTALLYIDLDDFKQINETYGHVIADEILKAVVDRLIATVRDGDVVARLGGDEFALLCRRPLPGGPSAIAQRVLRAFREPLVIEDIATTVTMSIGVATTRRGNYERLLGVADDALRAAKAAGKSRSIVRCVDQ